MPLQNENEIMAKPQQIKSSLYELLNNNTYELKHPKFVFLYRALLHLFFNFSNYCRRGIVKTIKLFYYFISIYQSSALFYAKLFHNIIRTPAIL